MSTVWDPDNLNPQDYEDYEDWWDASEFFDTWLYRHFKAQGMPSPEGGLERNDYGTQFFTCRECAAVVLSDGGRGSENLNTHRGWHDRQRA